MIRSPLFYFVQVLKPNHYVLDSIFGMNFVFLLGLLILITSLIGMNYKYNTYA